MPAALAGLASPQTLPQLWRVCTLDQNVELAVEVRHYGAVCISMTSATVRYIVVYALYSLFAEPVPALFHNVFASQGASDHASPAEYTDYIQRDPSNRIWHWYH